MKAYLSPLTADNQELRQCLSFFFPMYGCSSFENQKRMCNVRLDVMSMLLLDAPLSQIFVPIFLDNSEDRKDAKGSHDDSQYVSSTHLANMFCDWTDPIRLEDAS